MSSNSHIKTSFDPRQENFFSHPINRSLHVHMQLPTGIKQFYSGPNTRLLPVFMYANSECSDKTVHMHSLVRAFTGRPCKQYHFV